VSPYFQSPSVHGLSTREQIHDSFFASKWRLLEKSVNGFLVVSGEQIVDHINASGVTTLGDLLAFVNTLLVNNKFDDREWLLKTFISESAFGLLSEKNEENIEAILRIVFFDNSFAEDITGLMRKIVKLPTPNVARTTIPSFVAMLKHLEKGAISMSMKAFLAELVVHKEPFDDASIEGFVFGSLALADFELSFEDKFRPSAAFMRIVMLVALKELNNTEIINALVSILLEKIIEYQEFIIARKAPQTPLPFTPFHQMQLRVYQALCYWAPLIDEQTFKSVIEPVLFGPLLVWSNQPDARDYLESLAIFFLLKFHWPLDRLISVLNDLSLSSQAVASFVVIGGYLASYPGNVPQRQELMLALLPFLSSNIAYIRGVSQMWLHDADSQSLLPKDWVMIQSMLRFVKSNKESVQMRGKLKPVYAIWDPVHAIESGDILTLSSLIRNAELVPSRVFIDAVREGVHEALQNNWFYTRDLDSVIDEARTEIVNEKERNESNIGGKVNSQKKYAPPVTDMFPDALEEELKLNRRAETELVVVTSLLEKSANIAGLCRTAEVFGAAKLIVPTMHVLKDPQFSSMSVTAEQWIDIEEVPESSLESFLIEMKAKGYTVVCLEQTHDSVPIQEYDFAKSKTCLVLGNEKNGVPVPLLPLMDVCVEIPQRGVIRSLNVHVSGALAMWQYNMHR
jgi:tRNA G18 (ribose-2'-O)-methylase SpoU